MEEEIIFNSFCNVLGNWIALHDEDKHFRNNTIPQAKYTYGDQYIRANDAFSKLPDGLREAMISHEMGHRYLRHGANGLRNMLSNIFRGALVVEENAVAPIELEADLYGAGLIGYNNYIEALKAFRDMAVKGGRKLAAREYQLRAEALEGNIQ